MSKQTKKILIILGVISVIISYAAWFSGVKFWTFAPGIIFGFVLIGIGRFSKGPAKSDESK